MTESGETVRGSDLRDLPPAPPGRGGWPWTEAPSARPLAGEQVPSISIVTPSFNQGRFLEETLRSVLLQGYQNLEYRVVDGGSSDGSVELIERYAAHLEGWVSEPDAGPADAIAKGWRQSSGEILAYLNSDDVYMPGALASVAQAFANNSDAIGVCGWQLMMNDGGYVVRLKRVEEMTRRSLLGLSFVPQPSIFVRRQAVELCGGIDPRQDLIFDFELWLRLTSLGRFVILPRVLSATRWHPDTITVTRLPEIGRQLAKVIGSAARNDTSFSRGERSELLFGALRLAALYQLEPGMRTWHAPTYLARSLWHARGLRRRLGLLAAVWGRLYRQKGALDPELQSASNDIHGGRRHWSSWAPEVDQAMGAEALAGLPGTDRSMGSTRGETARAAAGSGALEAASNLSGASSNRRATGLDPMANPPVPDRNGLLAARATLDA